MWRALWLEKSGRSEAYFLGASPMPRLRQGDLVTIRKDTRIFGTFPDSLLHGRLENGRGYRIAKKTYQVKIRNIYPGSMQQDWPHQTNGIGAYVSNPTIVFVGAGGYWAEVDLNEIPEAIEKLIAGDVDSDRPRLSVRSAVAAVTPEDEPQTPQM